MFFQAARDGQHHIAQYVVGLILIFLAVMLGNLPLLGALMWKDGKVVSDVSQLYESALGNNALLALMLIPFVFGLVATLFVVARVHRRPVLSAITTRPGLDWRRVFVAFGLWFGLNLIFECISYLISPGDYSFRGVSWSFLALLLVACCLLPLQIAFEEILFRGYLLQGLGRLFKNRWLPLILTAVGFGLMHAQNPEVMEYGLSKMMIYYIGIGLILGIITILDNGLELALGIHAATNIYSAVVVSYESGALQTEALFHSQAEIADSSIISFLVIGIAFTFLLSRIYKWNDWSRLFRPIIFNKQDDIVQP